MHLLRYFHQLSIRPENANELRGLILQLAVQGKLTAEWRRQNPDVEPASELLKRIREEKVQLIKEKKIRKEKPLPKITPEEVPYKLPKGWAWSRMIDFCYLITDGTHHTPTYVESGIPFLSVKDMSKGYLDFRDTRFITKEEHETLIKRCHPEKYDILLTKVGTTGIATVIDTDEDFSIFVSVALLKIAKKEVFPYYIEHTINSPFIKKQSSEGTEGVGNKNLVLRKIKAFKVPLPPLEEQKAIVQIVNTLLQEVDQLEQLTAQRLQMKEDYAASALHQLVTAPASDAWAALKPHFHTFFNEAPNIQKLRAAILQLAVQGKLTAAWRRDNPGVEPAGVLLERIQREKARLVKEKKIKKEKPLPKIGAAEVPYEVPEGWEWCRLKNIGYITGGGTPSKRNSEYWGGNIPWVSPKDMKSNFISNSQDKVTKEGVNNSSAKIIPKGSLLVVGRSGILARTIPVAINTVECTVNQDLKVVVPFLVNMNIFLRLALKGMEKLLLYFTAIGFVQKFENWA